MNASTTLPPLPDEQLVCKLHVWVGLGEGVELFLEGVRSCPAFPAHEYLPAAAVETSSNDLERSRKHAAMVQAGQGYRLIRRRSLVLLQQRHMEDVVDASFGGEAQAVGQLRTDAGKEASWVEV